MTSLGGAPNAFEQVRLAHSRRTVDHERRRAAERFGDFGCAESGQPVPFPLDVRFQVGEAASRERLVRLGRPGSLGCRCGVCKRHGRLRTVGLDGLRGDCRSGRGPGASEFLVDLEGHGQITTQDFQAGFLDLSTKVRPQPVLIELVGHGDPQGLRLERDPGAAAEPHLVSLFTDLIRQCQKQGGYDLRIVLGHFLYSPWRSPTIDKSRHHDVDLNPSRPFAVR